MKKRVSLILAMMFIMMSGLVYANSFSTQTLSKGNLGSLENKSLSLLNNQ